VTEHEFSTLMHSLQIDNDVSGSRDSRGYVAVHL